MERKSIIDICNDCDETIPVKKGKGLQRFGELMPPIRRKLIKISKTPDL